MNHRDRFQATDRVTIPDTRIVGVHTVKKVRPPDDAIPHTFLTLILGQASPGRVIGEELSIEAWRCKHVPVVIQDKPA